MTGIGRLRTLAGEWDAYGLGGALKDVADQIERERACDEDTIENVRLIVGGVVTDMERHCLGHEGAEDSPVAHWARELRYALKSDTSDGRDAQNPSWHDHADAAGVTSDAPKVTRDPAEDVSMSAYDLLPADEREAIAWVREHGGLDSVKKLLDWVVGHCSTAQQLDFDFWLSGRVMYELGFDEDMADRDEVERRLLARLMPEGMEWPRYESGEPVGFGDEVSRLGEVFSISLYCDGSFALNFRAYSKGERVRLSAPKVLDADGVEIRVGDTVWHIRTGDEYSVIGVPSESVINVSRQLDGRDIHGIVSPYSLTHRAPVLAADGKPLREGEHVYHVETGAELVVKELPKPGEYQAVVVFALPASPASHLTSFDPDQLTHERPVADTWERLEEDAEKDPCGYFGFDGEEICGKCPVSGKNCEQTMARDLVRRCRALAERERVE